MLRELRIENIAVIEAADVSFGPGLNVMTGETGAGKSIILDAISAATGARVSRELIRTGADHAAVTAVFDSDTDSIRNWLRENEVDAEDGQVILHRRISADGKSTARICGVPVTAGQLRSLGSLLLELHGQNDGMKLLDESGHLEALDRFAALDQTDYRETYEKLRTVRRERDRLAMDGSEKLHLQESLQRSVRELEEAELQEGEYEELVRRRELLKNSEKLTEALEQAIHALNSEEGAIPLQKDALWNCRRAAGFAEELREAAEKLEQAGFLLSDVFETLQDFQDALSFSQDEYDRIEERLHLITRLERKYGKSVDDLPAWLEQCRLRLKELDLSEERLEAAEHELQKLKASCTELALQLRRQRKSAAKALAGAVEAELHDLNMPAARFEVAFTEERELQPTGLDAVAFLLAANRGEDPGRLSRIASGGELSRVMLALKNVLSRGDPVPTMVFDEIDTGVSGIAAQRVGEKLASLSGAKQVLCVTHLPQLASMADTHFVITKTERGGRTFTEVEPLDRQGRRRELARLHGGENITETTLRSAEEQLEYAEKYKQGVKHGSL
ncbi:MAG: DNA repair protein RecN [Oscillospiraceae bacterium]|nr:DNA repair protein RecN [Oscillospiraceae bacterium]